MTEPRQELPTDLQLSRLYREHAADGPADAIDQRILAAARQALSGPQASESPRRGWWQRWRMPLSLATTAMLTLMLAQLVERQPAELSVAPSQEMRAVESGPKRVEPASVSPAPAKEASGPASPEIKKTLPKAPDRQGERDRSPASNHVAEQVMDVPAPSAKAELAAPAPASVARDAAVGSEMRAAPALSAVPPAVTPVQKSRADGVRSPAVWLDEIRVLRSAGRTDEAERQLREFRLAYPDFVLPEEFRQ